MFINSLKKNVRAVAVPATCDCRAAVRGGQAHRNAAETAPALAAKQTHLCPRHRRARRLFSPSPLSGGELAFLPHSDTCRVLQPVLGNGLAGPISFCWKNWLLSSSPWFQASTSHSRGQAHSPWSPLHREDPPVPSQSHTHL